MAQQPIEWLKEQLQQLEHKIEEQEAKIDNAVETKKQKMSSKAMKGGRIASSMRRISCMIASSLPAQQVRSLLWRGSACLMIL